MRDRIRAMFLGVGIGDAMGMPVETWTPEKIVEKYKFVNDYQIPDGHKWFNGHAAGTYTDDTQLTLAVAEAIIEQPLDMDVQAKHHIAALKETDSGWGNSTRNSVRNLANGAHWSESGKGQSGVGNGVAMKIAPLGAYFYSLRGNRELLSEAFEYLRHINLMTHHTSISFSAALAQTFAVHYCLKCKQPSDFSQEDFKRWVVKASGVGKQILPETQNDDDLTARFEKLFSEPYDRDRLIGEFGGGSCYCYNSVPFSYGFFLGNPTSIESLYDVVNAGGDTDSNGAIVGALLGALNGMSIFPNHLIEGLVEKDRILDVADRFSEKIGFSE